jgi:predicted ATPase/Tfp pilus assembly protein PilF
MTSPSLVAITFLCIDVQDKAPSVSSAGSSLDHYNTILEQAIGACGGTVFKAGDDLVYAAFPTPQSAVAAALAAYWTMHTQSWGMAAAPQVRMALHSGPAGRYSTTYVGPTFNHAVSLLAACRSGQVLLSQDTYDQIDGSLPAGTDLHDLGEQRLKDLTRPEHIFQLLPLQRPTDISLSREPAPFPVNLPVLPSPLIGRDREVAEICDFLRRADLRLLTLLGSSGTGKTRLSLQVAVELAGEFEDGVYFVPLAPVGSAVLVASAIAQALSIKETGDRPLLEALQGHLAEREMLLILDNFEQLLEAVPLVANLLAAAPCLKILVTSHVGLGLPGEQLFPVPPLALPNPKRLPPLDELAHYPSIALFLVRAQVVHHDFALTAENAAAVAELCGCLAGIPLAIELVAAHCDSFTPVEMLAQVSERLAAERERTGEPLTHRQVLREALAWSYALLGPEDQALLARMGVFAGGCTLEAVSAVCNPEGDLTIDVPAGTTLLLSKNLLVQEQWLSDEPRYVMLDMVLQFSQARLADRGEVDQLRRSHAAYCLALAGQAEAGLTGADQEHWLQRLEDDLHNIRAALQWSSVHGEPATAVQLAGSLWRFWYIHGHLSEGRRWLSQALAAGVARDPLMPVALRTKALTGASVLSFVQGDYPRAKAFAEQNLSIFRALDDQRGIANTLSNMGAMAVEQGDYATAGPLLTESLALRRALGDTWGIAVALNNLARVIEGQGDYAQAESLYIESLALFREMADKGNIVNPAMNLGWMMLAQGQHERAKHYFRESLGLSKDLGYQESIANSLQGFAYLAAAAGRPTEAARLIGVVEAMYTQSDIQLSPIERARYTRAVEAIRAQLDEDAYAVAWAEGQTMDVGMAVGSVLD